jgi:response regulator RpfG family c-di-GMP phosphodiesterase
MYILVVDDEIEICDLIELTIHSFFQQPVELAHSGQQALELIQRKGRPEIIISDYHMPDGDGQFLLTELIKKKINCPFFICSSESMDLLKHVFPNINGYIPKPFSADEFVQTIKSMLDKKGPQDDFVPIRISHLLRTGEVQHDLYMKLGKENYVKVMHQGESFLKSDAERFKEKEISYLYIQEKDALLFLKSFEMNFWTLMASKGKTTEQKQWVILEGMDIIDKLGRSLGWRPELVATAKKCIDLALSCISTNPDILAILNKRQQNFDSFYSQHSGPLAMVCAVFCQQLGWVSESSQMKLAMAALMHDMTLPSEYFEHAEEWNIRARLKADTSSATVKYRNHPIEAAQLIQTIKNLPPDIDQIILQHHETPDSKGFPRGLSSGRISPMSAVFIISEDLVCFIKNHEDLDKKIMDFVESREKIYTEGNFKRVFQALKANLITHH